MNDVPCDQLVASAEARRTCLLSESLFAPEANELCGAMVPAQPGAAGHRAGHYDRTLQTKAGAMTLKMSKLLSGEMSMS